MRTRVVWRMAIVLAASAGMVLAAGADEAGLPEPDMDGGMPLMQALGARQSSRDFSTNPVPEQMLSDLLWAAWGVNRTESGKRTAPSALNWQEIDVYVAKQDGLFRYDAGKHRLQGVLAEDIRASCGKQGFVKEAPVVLIYVADRAKMKGNVDDRNKDFYAAVDTGYISQNVYLFCASEGLATVVLGWVDKPALALKMELRTDQSVILTQPVGYPQELQ